MYHWYASAGKCYVYLEDISTKSADDSGIFNDWDHFATARWLTRGWTLQELIAPPQVAFYGQDWKYIGTKASLSRRLSSLTNIPISVLDGIDEPWSCSVAQRMSWARGRSTTKLEDRAYSLMGLFRVNMPLIYGERHNAFRRLQEEIIKTHDDHSILLQGIKAWPPSVINYSALEGAYARAGTWDRCDSLATSPDDFPLDKGGVSLKEVEVDYDFQEEFQTLAASNTSSSARSDMPSKRETLLYPSYEGMALTGRGVQLSALVSRAFFSTQLCMAYWGLKFRGKPICVVLWKTRKMDSNAYVPTRPSMLASALVMLQDPGILESFSPRTIFLQREATREDVLSLRSLNINDSAPFRGRVVAMPGNGFDIVALAVLNKTSVVVEKKSKQQQQQQKMDWWAYRVNSSLEVSLKSPSDVLMFWCVLMPLGVSCLVCVAPMRCKIYDVPPGGLERYVPDQFPPTGVPLDLKLGPQALATSLDIFSATTGVEKGREKCVQYFGDVKVSGAWRRETSGLWTFALGATQVVS
jgi:hypothetical protein